MPSTDQLSVHLERLAAFDSGPFPVVSLYLNMRPDQHGRDNFDAYRGNGLGVVGAEDTAKALEMGQVEELLITGTADAIDLGAAGGVTTDADARTAEERTADDLIAKAHQTAARVTIIRDAELLAPVGGVGALLRFKL